MNKKARDYFGNEIEVGDDVVIMQLNYRNFIRASIKSISEKMLITEHDRQNTRGTETKQFHNQVIAVKYLLKESNDKNN